MHFAKQAYFEPNMQARVFRAGSPYPPSRWVNHSTIGRYGYLPYPGVCNMKNFLSKLLEKHAFCQASVLCLPHSKYVSDSSLGAKAKLSPSMRPLHAQSPRNSLRLFAVALNYNPNNHIWQTTIHPKVFNLVHGWTRNNTDKLVAIT